MKVTFTCQLMHCIITIGVGGILLCCPKWLSVNISTERQFENWLIHFFLLLLDFGLSRLTSLQFIQNHVAGFYKPTNPQSPPSHLQDYSICQVSVFSTIFVPSFDPNEWCPKNGLHIGGHESSALTTRPRLLAIKLTNTFYLQVVNDFQVS